jgi:hypothetical protein
MRPGVQFANRESACRNGALLDIRERGSEIFGRKDKDTRSGMVLVRFRGDRRSGVLEGSGSKTWLCHPAQSSLLDLLFGQVRRTTAP